MRGYSLTLPTGWVRLPLGAPRSEAEARLSAAFGRGGDGRDAVLARRRLMRSHLALLDDARRRHIVDLYVLTRGTTPLPLMSLALSVLWTEPSSAGPPHRQLELVGGDPVDLPCGPAVRRQREQVQEIEDWVRSGPRGRPTSAREARPPRRRIDSIEHASTTSCRSRTGRARSSRCRSMSPEAPASAPAWSTGTRS